MSAPEASHLNEALGQRRRLVELFLDSYPPSGLDDGRLLDGVREYLKRGGKCLRGAVCLLSCGLFGGREEDALPAAAAVEVFHAWTLAHDDIVDRDTVRRGGPTLHRHFQNNAKPGHDAPWYGLSLSLLAGDIQQAWSVEMLCRLSERVDPRVVLGVLREMSGNAVPQLVAGEVLDIELSGTPFAEIHRREILEMIEKKTAVLYRFAGRAGAWIGRGSCAPDVEVERLASFLTSIGIAFQLKDDLLGVTSTADQTGKDSDSDIREGKRTLIADLAWERADDTQQALLEKTLGNATASTAEIAEVRRHFQDSGAIAEVQALADQLVDRALGDLRHLPDRPQREVLERLALYLVQRDR